MLIKKQRILPPELTETNLKRYIADRMLFRKEQFVLEPSIDYPQGGLFGDLCQEWQVEFIYRPLDLRDENGWPVYKLLYMQLPKKSGKTALLAGEVIVQLLLSPRPTEENYILAGDREQASYVLKKVKDFI